MNHKINQVNQYCLLTQGIELSKYIRMYYTQIVPQLGIVQSQFFVDILSESNLPSYQSYLDQRVGDDRFAHRQDRRTALGYIQELIL